MARRHGPGKRRGPGPAGLRPSGKKGGQAGLGKGGKSGKAGPPRAEEEGEGRVPRSMVFERGSIGRTLRRLEKDLRHVMMPHTAAKLKESKRNSLKDFLHIAGPLGVTHFMALSASSLAPYLRLARTPRGPTLTFRICAYSLAADVANAQAKPRVPPNIFHTPPLVVMNGLGAALGEKQQQHLKLVSIMFQNMFPAIDVSTVRLSECRRVLLLNYDAASRVFELRHYSVTAKPVEVSRSIRKLVQSHSVPNLAAFADISEFVISGGYGSESEAEDETSRVCLAQNMGRANRASQQSAVQLHELGPRLTLQLIKVEDGLLSGAVMFHEYVKKSAEEVKQQRKEREAREQLKKRRREEQEENVLRKQRARLEQQQKGTPDREEKEKGGRDGEEGATDEEEAEEEVEGDEAEDEDAMWYRKEVGEEMNEERRQPRLRGRAPRGRLLHSRAGRGRRGAGHAAAGAGRGRGGHRQVSTGAGGKGRGRPAARRGRLS